LATGTESKTEAERRRARREANEATDNPQHPGTWKPWHTAAAVGIVLLIVAGAVFAASSDDLASGKGNAALWAFLALAVLLAAFTGLVGWGITGLTAGALVDPKKGRMSLSRLQLLLWTALILSALLTAFLVNVSADSDNPLTVAIPAELLIAMGISVTSLVGTGVVLNQKLNQESGPAPERVRLNLEARDVGIADDSTGVLKADRALLRDVFEGDTPETATYLDLGKIQLFYITVALVLGYGIAVADMFASVANTTITELPAIDEAFVGLLAISHAGYLTAKAAS
jgi:hypothetical protein